MKSQKITFTKFKDFSNVLVCGQSKKNNKRQFKKDVLVIMDITGSMNEHINENSKEGTKYTVAKQLLTKLEKNGNNLVILPFNNTPKELCEIKDIPEPCECTFFSPIVPVISNLLSTNHNYSSIIFMSDGLPTESEYIAHTAIKSLGRLVREGNCNPVSVAIGDDADGHACALFSGNRGYECFIKHLSQIEKVVEDMDNGISCEYEMIESGEYIPIEANGNYYYLDYSTETADKNCSIELLMKYLNLIILSEFSKINPNLSDLKELVKISTNMIESQSNKDMIINHFDKIIGTTMSAVDKQKNKSSLLSNTKQIYRGLSQQV